MRTLHTLCLASSTVALAVLLSACSSLLGFEDLSSSDDSRTSDLPDADSGPPDVSSEVSTDSSTDAQPDSGLDSSTDSGIDSSTDSGIDSSTDSGIDSSTDSGIDSSTDSGIDSSTDSGIDSSTDSGIDSSDGSSCGDTLSSSKNCGVCGHDCLDGKCDQGVCQPLVLASGLFGPRGITLDSTHAYVTEYDANKVIRVPLDKPGIETIATNTFASAPLAIQAVGEYVYWSNKVFMGGSISRCPKSGCTATSYADFVPTLKAPRGFIITQDTLLWAENGGHLVGAVDFPSGTNARTLFGPVSSAYPADITTFGKFAYFVDDSVGELRRVPLAGGTVEIVGGELQGSSLIHAASSGVFWSAGSVGTGKLWFLPVDNKDLVGSPVLIAEAQAAPAGIATDDQNVYWANSGSSTLANGALMWCPLSGCGAKPRTLASALHSPARIAVSANAVYWVEAGLSNSANDGSVKKIAKP